MNQPSRRVFLGAAARPARAACFPGTARGQTQVPPASNRLGMFINIGADPDADLKQVADLGLPVCEIYTEAFGDRDLRKTAAGDRPARRRGRRAVHDGSGTARMEPQGRAALERPRPPRVARRARVQRLEGRLRLRPQVRHHGRRDALRVRPGGPQRPALRGDGRRPPRGGRALPRERPGVPLPRRRRDARHHAAHRSATSASTTRASDSTPPTASCTAPATPPTRSRSTAGTSATSTPRTPSGRPTRSSSARKSPWARARSTSLALFAKLRELKFTGPIIIEREISGPQQIEDIRKAKADLERLLREIV